jgi:hypothetical protein
VVCKLAGDRSENLISNSVREAAWLIQVPAYNFGGSEGSRHWVVKVPPQARAHGFACVVPSLCELFDREGIWVCRVWLLKEPQLPVPPEGRVRS